MKILAYRLPELTKMVEKFNKKADKWSLPRVEFSVVETGFEERKVITGQDDEGRATESKFHVEYAIVEIEGETPRLNGWAIHSKVQPSEVKGQNFVFTTKDFSPLEMLRTKPLFCDHCQTKRLKKNSYWIVHEDGRSMMVGATCLKDFLPSVDVDSLISYMNQIAIIEESDWEEEMPPRGEWVYPVKWAVQEAYLSIKKWGYISKKMNDEDPTKQPTAWDIDPAKAKRAEMYKDVDLVAVENELANFIPHMMAKSDAGNDFLYNVKLALQQECIKIKMYGYIAAAVNMWIRDLDAARESQASKPSQYQGTVGASMTFKGLTITSVMPISGYYGTSYLYMFMDAEGNKFKWFANSELPNKAGEVVTVRAKVKGHEEYKGSKQTVLTRGKVL